jgi:CMP-N,N'-diacetyllegionaminic acid synthase
MVNGQIIVAVVPARGGSEGVPHKNIRSLAGKPLIEWTIAAARLSEYVDRVIVSTDDKEIAAVSRAAGAEVPFLRPAELASSNAKGIDVAIHAACWLRDHEQFFDNLIWLQPTSPLRTKDDIDGAIEFMNEKQADAVVSVCEAEHHPLYANSLPPDLSMKKFIPRALLNKNRKDLPPYYRLNGAIYLMTVEFLTVNRAFIGPNTYAYIMSQERSLDIDTEIDFKIADFFIRCGRTLES